jgi:hypothetical protein
MMRNSLGLNYKSAALPAELRARARWISVEDRGQKTLFCQVFVDPRLIAQLDLRSQPPLPARDFACWWL